MVGYETPYCFAISFSEPDDNTNRLMKFKSSSDNAFNHSPCSPFSSLMFNIIKLCFDNIQTKNSTFFSDRKPWNKYRIEIIAGGCDIFCMDRVIQPTRRQALHLFLGLTGFPLLSSCGTILYPDRAYQTKRGQLDPAIVILDGIGLFFFIIPGLVAFAVDFTTGAIYFPADYEPGDRERTIFDRYEAESKLDEQEIKRIVALKTGKPVDLADNDVRVMRLESLDQFAMACTQLSDATIPATRKSAFG